MMENLMFFLVVSFLGVSGLGVGGMIYSLFVFMVFMIMILSELGDIFFFDDLFFYDGVSVGLVILSLWIGVLMLYSSYKVLKTKEFSWFFVFLIYSLVFILTITFFSGSFLLFYFFFEASLIPTLLIIMGWGYQPERLQAGVYFLFYTLTASLPLLLLMIYLFETEGSLTFFMSMGFGIGASGSKTGVLVGLMGIMAFLVSLPLFFTHLWLPSAHVEAPVAGSMILAGVLLKLGGYGLMRMFLWMGSLINSLSFYFIGLSLVGMIYVGLVCCRINDFKALVAYSSVAHMALVVCGVLALSMWGYEGGLMMMIGHGLSSSGLFCSVNMYYERTGSRSFYLNKGMLVSLPIFSLLFFMLSAANIAAPPSINLMSEIFLMASILNYDYFMLAVFPIGTMLGAVFTIFMFSYSQHGSMYNSLFGFSFSSIREVHTLIMHIIPANVMILGSNVIF